MCQFIRCRLFGGITKVYRFLEKQYVTKMQRYIMSKIIEGLALCMAHYHKMTCRVFWKF